MKLEKARARARAAAQSLYEGVCSVVEYRDYTDETTKITRKAETTVLENQPCRLSFESKTAAVQSDTATGAAQGTKLFLAPETEIKAGSKIIVTQNGVTGEYAMSGKPAVYATHQEIMLELFRGWA